MRDYPELMILRHGETEWNRVGRMQGELDSPLTETGRAQARTQGELIQARDLTGWSWFSSPQGRAVNTARIVADGQAAELRFDDRLVEIGVGEWTGKSRDEIRAAMSNKVELADLPETGITLYKYAPGGEGFAALRERAADFLGDLTGPSVLVTHGITSRMLRAVVMGLNDDELDDLPGGQGVIYHMKDGVQTRLE